MKFPLLYITAFLITGICFSKFFAEYTTILIPCLIALLTLTIHFVSPLKRWQTTTTYAFIFSLSISIGAIGYHLKTEKQYVVPSLKKVCIDRQIKSSKKYFKYFVKDLNGHKLLAYISKENNLKTIGYNDILIGDFRTSEIPSVKNPHQFDYKNYLSNKNIHYQIFINKDTPIYLLKSKSTSSLTHLFQFKNKIIKSLENSSLSSEAIAISKALFLGDKISISKDLKSNFLKAGVIHILAVSGLHIGIILFLLNFLLSPIKKLPKGNLIQVIIITCMLWYYAIFLGLPTSIIRATFMFSLYAISKVFLNRNVYSINILITALFITLVFDPQALFDVSFQMSYTAMFSIFLFYPFFKIYRPKNIIIKNLWNISSISLSVQIGMLPIILFYFHQFPGLFLISNLPILLFLPFFIGFGFITILFIYQDLFYLNNIFDFTATTLVDFIKWIAHFDDFIFKEIPFNTYFLLGLYFCVISLYFILKRQGIYKIKWALICVICFQLTYLFQINKQKNKDEFIVFNIPKESAIGINKNGIFSFYTDTITSQINYVKRNYILEDFVSIHKDFELKNAFINKKRILYLDDNLIYKTKKPIDILILGKSPRINLERVLSHLKPRIVVADGSNYTFLKKRWKKTCKNAGFKFYDTSQRGAYITSNY